MIVIDGVSYAVNLISLDASADFLDKFAERTEDGILHRELIGVYFNYKLQFGSPNTLVERQAHAALWLKLTEPTEFHTVIVPEEDGTEFTFIAYFAGVGRSLKKAHDAKTYWKTLTVNFIAQAPART